MSDADRERWNRRYQDSPRSTRPPSTVLTEFAAPFFDPAQLGSALDLASGPGRHGLWLAARGVSVTLCDVSDVALSRAHERAPDLDIQTIPYDLDRPLVGHATLGGPWDLVISVNYLNRAIFAQIPALLGSGGIFVFAQPTVRNLERNPKPSRRFLLEEGELRTLVPEDLQVLAYGEAWTEAGRHEARLVAAKPGRRTHPI